MNVFIPGYKPTVQDPKKDVSQLPKELMSKMPGKTDTTVPGGVPEVNMSRMPTAPQTMSVAPTKPAQSVNPIINPLGANITGVPTAVNPIMQQTAKETPKMEVPGQKNDKIFNAVIDRVTGEPQTISIPEFEYEKASQFFDTIDLDQDEVDYIDYAVQQGYEFKDAMLYIALRRQRAEKEQKKDGGFVGAVDRIMMAPYKGIYSAMESMTTGITGGVIADVMDLFGYEGAAETQRSGSVKSLNQLGEMNQDNKGLIEGFTSGDPASVIQTLTGGIANLLLAMSGVGAVAMGASTGGSLSLEGEIQGQTGAGDKATAYGAGAISALIDRFSGGKILDSLVAKGVEQGVAKNFVQKTLDFLKSIKSSTTEAGTEMIQQKVEDWGRDIMGINYDRSWKDYAEAGLLGKILGSVGDVAARGDTASWSNFRDDFLELNALKKLGGMGLKIATSPVDTLKSAEIAIANSKIGEKIIGKEGAARIFADLDNAEIGAIKNIGPAKVQEMIDDLNQIDAAALEGGGRGNIYNKLNVEVMEGIGKRSKELSEIEKVRKQIVKDTDAPFTKAEIQSIFDEEIAKQGISRKTGDKGSEYSIVGEGAIKESELSKLDDLERELFRTDKEEYTSVDIDKRIQNLQKNLYDKDGKPKNGSESVTRTTENIIAKLNERYKEKMPPEYAEAKEKMSQILTDRRRILKELKEEGNTIALGRDIDKMDEAELGKLIEDSIAGNRMALFLRRLASNTTTGGDPQSLAETVKRFTGIDVENRALALRALAKATGKTQIANELGGLLNLNKPLYERALAGAAKIVTPSGEKTIKELASRGKAKDIPYEPKTVKYEGKKVEKPTANKFVKTVTEEKVEPSTVDYARAKGMIERPTMKAEARKASNLTAARHDRRGVIVTPQGEVKALPPAQPVWVQQMDGQYSDPQGYLKALQRDILDENLQLKEVSDFGKTTSTDELNYLLNDRNVQTKESFYDLILKRNEMKNDVGFTKLLDDAYRNNIDEVQNYYMGDADYKLFNSPVQIGAIRSMFGEDIAKDLLDGFRYMEKNGYEDVTGTIGKSGKQNKALERFSSAVEQYNSSRNLTKGMELTPDEVYNIIKDIVSDIQKKQKKFQTIAERYEVAPEISVAQAREIMGKDFPIKIVDKLQTPEGRKAMGMYYQGAIEIAKNPVSTTGYHEAFHAWLDIYGPSRLRDAAYKQIERTVGITNKIDIEEHLAEAFAMWKLSGRGVSGALKQFFQAIWEDIKSLIGKQDKVVDLFRNVGKKGRMNEMSKNRMLQDLAYESPNGITTKVLEELQGRTSVSKQFIENLLRRDDVRQVEKEIFAEKLRNFGDKVDIGELSDQVRAELLPLKPKTLFRGEEAKYENVALPDEIRGDFEDYWENVYESPVKTGAGDTHFRGDTQNYFGHTRVEDMADGKTRRVIEVQSDLYQKGNLEKEARVHKNFEGAPDEELPSFVKERRKELNKLKQYSDPTAHFRMVREEIAKAAKDGKTKLQFPTGETAMKVEGLGNTLQSNRWIETERATGLTVDKLKVGLEVADGHGDWIITDVLEGGKFKAVPKRVFDEAKRGFDGTDNDLITKYSHLDGSKETFDISGKVDQSNPIYKFYENEMQKYLKRFGAQRVTDDKGVEWFEVPIKEEYGKRPVQAFQSTPDIIVGKGKVFYHGTSKENYDSILKNGWDTSKNKKGFAEDPHAMYVSTSTEANSDHSAGTYGKYILKVEPKGEIKMLDSNSRKWLETAGTSRNMKETQEWHKKLAKEGYDGIMESNGEVIIFNPDKFKITGNQAIQGEKIDIVDGVPVIQGKGKSFLDTIRSPEYKARMNALNDKRDARKVPRVTKTSNNLYHTTKVENLDSIAKNGLKTGMKPRYEGVSSPTKISFSANEAGANYYGGSNDVMIRTKRSYKPDDLEIDYLAGGDGTYMTGKNIPPEMLEVKIKGKWVDLIEYYKSKK